MKDCLLWTGSVLNHGGYGKITIGKKSKLAHRVVWESIHGSIPAGMCVCHTCDTPLCINPSHLFLGTVADNNADMVAKGRLRVPKLKGIQHGRSKITESDVKFIRESKATRRELQDQFKLSRAQVNKIRKGTSWTHLNAQ